jgi:Fe2+ or Zn2+ uptake regulation protein
MFYPGSLLKSSIIAVLAKKPGLNAKEIHYLLGEGNLKTSLQALYNAVHSLEEEQVILKFKDELFLSPLYVSKVTHFATNLSRNDEIRRSYERIIESIERRRKTRKNFKSKVNAYSYLRSILAITPAQAMKLPTYLFLCHIGTMFLPQDPYALEQWRTQHEMIAYLSGKTAMDKQMAEVVSAQGLMNIQLVEEDRLEAPFTEYVIYNDHIAEITVSEKHRKQYDRILKKSKLQGFPSSEFLNFIKGESVSDRIGVCIEKNPQRASELVKNMQSLTVAR